jgi:hypothetical protein
VSSSNQLLLSILVAGLVSCAGERAEISPPATHETSNPLDVDPAELSEMAAEIERRETHLASERDSTLTVASAVLHDFGGSRQRPALGMAVVEVNAGGLALRIAAELEQGIHHVYILDEVTACERVDLKKDELTGTPDPYREGYLGALENVRSGAATFERHLSDGSPSYRTMLGRPLLIVNAKSDRGVCGVIQETNAEPVEAAISSR